MGKVVKRLPSIDSLNYPYIMGIESFTMSTINLSIHGSNKYTLVGASSQCY